VDWLTRRTSNCANGKRLRHFLRITIVAFCPTFLNDLDLTVEAHGATLDQGHVGGEAHLVHVAAGVEVVEGIEDEGEGLKPFYVELGVFDVGVVGGEGDGGVEL
jgi:hypothetical protein